MSITNQEAAAALRDRANTLNAIADRLEAETEQCANRVSLVMCVGTPFDFKETEDGPSFDDAPVIPEDDENNMHAYGTFTGALSTALNLVGYLGDSIRSIMIERAREFFDMN